MDKTSLGDRMKGYEKIPSVSLMKKTPVIIRLDGKAFHTYTRGCDKPFDSDLNKVRETTMKYLVDNIQGCLMGYSQSDEISLVLKDWDTYNTDAWFGNKVQKLCSISASMCTAEWSKVGLSLDSERVAGSDKFSYKIALFDSRCFNVPNAEEVVNYLIWRQQDWERNSVQMIAQSLYPHKSLQGKSCKQLTTQLEEDKGIVWGELESWKKRGEFYCKDENISDNILFKDNRDSLIRLLEQTYN